MTLKEKIAAYKKTVESKIPKEVQAVMHRATEELRNPDRMAQTIQVGDAAPDFTLQNTALEDVSRGDLLSRGLVVLVFYRGRW